MMPPAASRCVRRSRRHRPLRQPSSAHRGRADPEPDPGRPVLHGARRPRADDHPGRRGDHPQTLINIRPVTAAIKEFFGTSQMSQFMDQNNPCRPDPQASSVGAGPRRSVRERALEVRDVHPSHYGRMPDRDPEGPEHRSDRFAVGVRAGQPFGFIETPHRKVDGGRHRRDRLPTADEEDRHAVVAQANSPLDARQPLEDRVWFVVRAARSSTSPPPRWTTRTSRRARWCRWPRP